MNNFYILCFMCLLCQIFCAPTVNLFYDAIVEKCPSIESLPLYKSHPMFTTACSGWKLTEPVSVQDIECSLFFESFTRHCTWKELENTTMDDSVSQQYKLDEVCRYVKSIMSTIGDNCTRICGDDFGVVRSICHSAYYFAHLNTSKSNSLTQQDVSKNQNSQAESPKSSIQSTTGQVEVPNSKVPARSMLPSGIQPVVDPAKIQTGSLNSKETSSGPVHKQVLPVTLKAQNDLPALAAISDNKPADKSNNDAQTALKPQIAVGQPVHKQESNNIVKKVAVKPPTSEVQPVNEQESVKSNNIVKPDIEFEQETEEAAPEKPSVEVHDDIKQTNSALLVNNEIDKKSEKPVTEPKNIDANADISQEPVNPQQVNEEDHMLDEEIGDTNEQDDPVIQPPMDSPQNGKDSKPLSLDESDSVNYTTEMEGDSYFFTYFMLLCLIFIVGYVCYHNKQKILALMLEGRKGKRQYRGRRPNSANYHKLDSNLEEAITSSCKKNTSNVIY